MACLQPPSVGHTEPYTQDMTRQYYPASQYPREDLDYYHHSNRNVGSRLSHERSIPLVDASSRRDNPRACPLNRQSPRTSPPEDPQSYSGNNAPRRRIAVACGRCRKRKIKCSGDPMDGTGCNNCKSSGTDPGQCLFLRVQCEVRELVPDHVELTRGYNQVSSVECPPNVWSYTSSLSSLNTSPSQLSGGAGMLSASTNTSINSMVPMTVPNSNYTRMNPSTGFIGSQYPTMPSKTTYPSPYGNGFAEDPTDSFNLHSPPYMLPSQDSVNAASGYGSHDTLRGWGPIGQSSKSAGNGLFLEQDSPQPYGTAHLPYLHPVVSRMPSVTTDGSSFFPAMTSLVSSLPLSSTAGDRVLPNPALGRPQPSASCLTTTGVAAGDSVPMNYYGSSQTQPITYKTSQTWGCDSSSSSGTSQGPTMTATSNSTGTMTPSMRKGSMTNTTDSSLGYITISATPESPGTAPAMNYLSSGLPVPGLLPSQSSSNLYSYSTDTGLSKRDSIGEASVSEEGTLLVSGQAYTRLRQPQLQHPGSLEALRSDSLDMRPHSVHRSSVAGLTATKGY